MKNTTVSIEFSQTRKEVIEFIDSMWPGEKPAANSNPESTNDLLKLIVKYGGHLSDSDKFFYSYGWFKERFTTQEMEDNGFFTEGEHNLYDTNFKKVFLMGDCKYRESYYHNEQVEFHLYENASCDIDINGSAYITINAEENSKIKSDISGTGSLYAFVADNVELDLKASACSRLQLHLSGNSKTELWANGLTSADIRLSSNARIETDFEDLSRFIVDLNGKSKAVLKYDVNTDGLLKIDPDFTGDYFIGSNSKKLKISK